ncbi:MAG: DMT family transporter [Deltaproteobacteria bacterium]|nr:DMT family transporter [Deltaproteobacteria bacterium]
MRGSLLIACSASLWGLWSIFYRSAERAALPTVLSAEVEGIVVLGLMGVVLLPIALRDCARAPARARGDWLRLCFAGVLDGLNFLTFLLAMQRTTVAVAVLTHYLAPLVVALLAPLLLGERWRLRTFGALAAALLGLGLLLQPWAHPLSGPELSGALFGAASALCYGGSVVVQKRLVTRFSAWELGAFSKAPALLILLLVLPSAHDLVLAPAPLAWLLAGGLLCGALPLVLFFTGLATTPASRAGVLTLCEPLVAVLAGALVWQEPLGASAALGAGLMLVAAAWMSKGEPSARAPGPSASSGA